MNGEIDRTQELRLLSRLCQRLAKLGMGVQIRDALPALTVTSRDAAGGRSAHVMVNPTGSRFTWWQVDTSHPVADVDGAAERIAEFIQQPPQADESCTGQ